MCLSGDALRSEGIEEEGESWSMKTNKTGKCKIMQKKNSKRVRGSGYKKEIIETEAEAKAERERQIEMNEKRKKIERK